MNETHLFFDIESEALPEAELLARFNPTFEANKTLKDPEKIAADLATKRQSWLDESALRAERGRILCIGAMKPGGNQVVISEGDEDAILRRFITTVEAYKGATFCGFNIMGFDLPFIRRRCIINGIPFPFYNRSDKWKPWMFKTYDPMIDWQCGDYKAPYIGLVTLAKALGIPAEDDGIGAKFGETWRTNKPAALAHCVRDVELCAKVCERMLA